MGIVYDSEEAVGGGADRNTRGACAPKGMEFAGYGVAGRFRTLRAWVSGLVSVRLKRV
jgi:hypothetical protein